MFTDQLLSRFSYDEKHKQICVDKDFSREASAYGLIE